MKYALVLALLCPVGLFRLSCSREVELRAPLASLVLETMMIKTYLGFECVEPGGKGPDPRT